MPALRKPRKPGLGLNTRRVTPTVATHAEQVAYKALLRRNIRFNLTSVLFPREARVVGIQPSFTLEDGSGLYLGFEDGRTALYRAMTGRILRVTQAGRI